MGFDRIRIKENARRHYEVNKWQNVLVCLILVLVQFAVQIITRSTEKIPLLAFLVSLVMLAVNLLVVNPLTMGGNTWFHRSIKREGMKMDEMFWIFKENYMDNVLMIFLIGLFTALWSLLFIIPGIIKGISYSMAYYIKSENPNLSASRAIELSKIITEGHKMDLFVLGLSFIGWNLLSVLTLGILGVLYVHPYYYAAMAFAYEEIKEDAFRKQYITETDIYGYGYGYTEQ